MNISPQKIGELGEKIATQYLKEKGYKILERNFKRRWGEIDIVASPSKKRFWFRSKQAKKIIFVEVKSGLKEKGFFPEDRVDRKKKNQLRKMAQIYLSENKIPEGRSCQIDIIAVEFERGSKKAKIRHYKNAVEDWRN